MVPGPKTDDLPPWLDPRTAAKDSIVRTLHTKADYDDYMAYRAQGYTAEQARDMVRPDVDTIADTRVHDQMEARRQDAYDNAYDQAIIDGKSPDEARQAASDAAREQHHADSVDHQNRRDVLDAAGTYKGAYDQVSGLIDHTPEHRRPHRSSCRRPSTTSTTTTTTRARTTTVQRPGLGDPMSAITETQNPEHGAGRRRARRGHGRLHRGPQEGLRLHHQQDRLAREHADRLQPARGAVQADRRRLQHRLARCRRAGATSGLALGAVGDNYRSMSGQLPAVWEGPASHAAQRRLTDIADMHDGQQEATPTSRTSSGTCIEVAQATAEVVAAALSFINDIITELLLDAASGPFGWAKGAISAPGKARKVISLIHRGIEAIQKFTRAVKAVVAVLRYVNAGLSAADTVLQFGNVAASTRRRQPHGRDQRARLRLTRRSATRSDPVEPRSTRA